MSPPLTPSQIRLAFRVAGAGERLDEVSRQLDDALRRQDYATAETLSDKYKTQRADVCALGRVLARSLLATCAADPESALTEQLEETARRVHGGETLAEIRKGRA